METSTRKLCVISSTNTQQICEIQGYWVTETKIDNGEGTARTFFNIRNKEGEVVGYDFDTVEEPVGILFQIDKYNK